MAGVYSNYQNKVYFYFNISLQSIIYKDCISSLLNLELLNSLD